MGGECFEPKEGRAAGPDSECGKDGPEASRNTSSPGTAVSGVWAGCCGIHAGPHRFVFELVLCSGSVDGDGCHELVVGHTDRVVRAFRWEDLGEGTDHPTGQLVSLKKWTLEGQVDSLSVTPGPLGVPELMVSQPGCAYATLLCTWSKDAGPAAASEGATEGSRETPAARDVVLHQTSGRIHNKNVSTHLIGNIKRGKGPSVVCAGASPERGGSGLFALCTLDGTLKLMEEADRLLWSVQVDHQLFALEKLDVTGNGHEEVVACAWDGQTYIIDHNRAVVRFQVDENIRAFCAGGTLPSGPSNHTVCLSFPLSLCPLVEVS